MKTVIIKKIGSPEFLQLEETPIPVLKPHEVLIRVHAAGVNRPDIFQRQGSYPSPPDASPILGLEVAGEIVGFGAKVNNWKLDDRVCALVNGGGYAEYAVAPASQCLPIPQHFSYVQAAALPENFFTVWHNLFQRAQLKAGESLLIHGGSSGIGTAAIQMAVALGVKVFVTAGSSEKCSACERLGATAINYRDHDFVAEIKALTNGEGVNVILDMVGGDYIQRNFSAAAKEGRIVNIAFLHGSKTQVDFTPLMLKRLTLTGSTLRAQPAETKANIADELRQEIWPLLNAGKIKPVIDRIFPLADVADAHRLMETGAHIGKIMLELKS